MISYVAIFVSPNHTWYSMSFVYFNIEIAQLVCRDLVYDNVQGDTVKCLYWRANHTYLNGESWDVDVYMH